NQFLAPLYLPTGAIRAVAEGRYHGVIVDAPRGSGGFGYDPLFFIPEYHQTFGELSPRVKQALSTAPGRWRSCGRSCGGWRGRQTQPAARVELSCIGSFF